MNEHAFNRKQWQQLDIFNQMGNIGLEVSRALRAKRSGNGSRMNAAFYRGMDLINATVESQNSQGKGVRELLIAREQFAQSILTDDEDPTLEKYFMEFAVAARMRQFA